MNRVLLTKDMAPEIYSTESRDFQLVSKVFDLAINSVINNEAKMKYLSFISKIDAKLLRLLASYIGFFSDQYYPENLLRSILANFPDMIKNKGNITSLEIAIKALQNAYTSISDIKIEKDENIDLAYRIKTDGVIIDSNYVNDVLKYVRPAGVIISSIDRVEAEDLEPQAMMFRFRRTNNTPISIGSPSSSKSLFKKVIIK